MASKKKNRESQDTDTIIRGYVEDQDPGLEIIEEVAEAGTQSRQQPGELRSRQDFQKKEAAPSAGDPDANLDAGSSGDETVGGSNPTPDQGNVDELGEAVGLTFEDSEELEGEKISARDTHRWELDPASSEDYEERTKRYK
ncbi:MAG: hypothetical protein H0W49_10355 [Nitrospirales bacterium]|nr:hypothetical protein [Nitrospirales bacterium]